MRMAALIPSNNPSQNPKIILLSEVFFVDMDRGYEGENMLSAVDFLEDMKNLKENYQALFLDMKNMERRLTKIKDALAEVVEEDNDGFPE